MGFESYLDEIRKKWIISFQYHQNCQHISDNTGVIEFSLMQPSKNTVFACFYALFDQYYVKRWDLKLI